MSHESLYQQLRSHLAYLGLATAAEHLPGQLEKARQEEIGHTEFIEELLRIEVEATRARRWKMRMKLANFPTSWTLQDFDFAAQPGVRPQADNRTYGRRLPGRCRQRALHRPARSYPRPCWR